MKPIDDLETKLMHEPNDVLVIAGAGVARASDGGECASWAGLLHHGVEHVRQWCTGLPAQWVENNQSLIEEKTAEAFVLVAGRIESALRESHDGNFGAWLRKSVGQLQLRDRTVIEAILDWNTCIATLNYDNLFEEASKLPAVTWDETDLAIRVLTRESSGILHLHGYFSHPDTVVFSNRSYDQICRDPSLQQMLKGCFIFRTVVFIGCGATIDDPNFGGLWRFCKVALQKFQRPHFHLVLDSELVSVAAQYKGLPVTPIAYGASHSDLGPFLTKLTKRVCGGRVQPTSLDVLRSSQNDYDAALRELRQRRSEMPSMEFIQRTFELARELSQSGGQQTAALAMDGVLMASGMDISPDQRVRYGLETAEKLLEVGLDFHAACRLQALASFVDQASASPAERSQFRLLFARTLSARAAPSESLKAIEAALPVVSAGDRTRLEAERAELYLLDGNIDEAERTSGEGEVE